MKITKKFLALILSVLVAVLVIPLSGSVVEVSALEKLDVLIWSPGVLRDVSVSDALDDIQAVYNDLDLKARYVVNNNLSKASQMYDLSELGFIMVYLPNTSISLSNLNVLKEFNEAGVHIMFVGENSSASLSYGDINGNVSTAVRKFGFNISFSNSVDTTGGVGVAAHINSDSPLLKNVTELAFVCAGSISQTDNATETVLCENKVCLVGKQVGNGYISVVSDCNVFEYSTGAYNHTSKENITIFLFNCYSMKKTTSAPTSYFMVSSDQYSVDSINGKENATYKIHLLDQNSSFLPIDNVTVQNNTEYIIDISTKKVSDTELELTVKPLSNGDASISLFNGNNSNPQYFNFTVYSNTTTYRADQVPVTNQELKTNFSRGDLTVDNFEYIFDENKGKYIATMDVYNRSGAIGVVAAYTQDGKISAIEQVDPYIPLPGDFGEFLVYLGSGAVGILKGENWNYRFAGDSQKTSIEIEVPEDGYLTVSCDVTSDNAAFIYNLVSIGVDFAFKTAEVIDVLGTDTDKLAKDTTKTLAKKVSEYFNEDSEWTKGAIKKLAKKLSKQFNMAYLEEISVLSLEMLDEMYKNVGEDFSDVVLDVIIDLTKEEIKEFGVMAAAKKLVKDKVIGTAEKTLLKAASIMFDGGSYINLLNSILGAYRYNVGTGKTMVVFKPNGEDGFICKDTIKVTSDIITDEVLLHTYVIKDTQKEDAFVRKTIYSDFNRGDGLRKEELSIDLNRIVEIHEISLWKNGQEVFDTFTATVEMNLPSYIDRRTCSIYRVEKDGTYTKLDTKIEGNKIIFETNHFSEYILTGVIEDLQETTPCDGHIYEEVRVEPTCTETGSITYTCYCGDTYTETIPATGHSFDGSECTNCDYDKADECDCNCHTDRPFAKFFFKIKLFFQKLFKKNAVCACGVAHY